MGPFFSKARYINGVGFEILARTPVPLLPLSYPPSPPPPPRPPPPPDASYQVSRQMALLFRRRSPNYIFKMATVAVILDCRSERF